MNLFSLLKIKAYNTTNHSRYFYYILILVILSYLILGVGLHGDDYAEINKMDGFGLWEFLNPDPNKTRASKGVNVRNPVFDVTTDKLITGLINEKGVVYNPDSNKISNLFKE